VLAAQLQVFGRRRHARDQFGADAQQPQGGFVRGEIGAGVARGDLRELPIENRAGAAVRRPRGSPRADAAEACRASRSAAGCERATASA